MPLKWSLCLEGEIQTSRLLFNKIERERERERERKRERERERERWAENNSVEPSSKKFEISFS